DRLPGQRALHADAARRRPLRSGFFRACAIVTGSVAGWSSLVARWAHNPKVVGSNPAPATKNSLTKTTTQRMANADPKVGVLLCGPSVAYAWPHCGRVLYCCRGAVSCR